jgi:hypothetical protein
VARSLVEGLRNPSTKVSASEDDPRFVVKSDKSGKRAAHRPEALDKH